MTTGGQVDAEREPSHWSGEHLKRKGLEGYHAFCDAWLAAGHQIATPCAYAEIFAKLKAEHAEAIAKLEAALKATRERNATLEGQLKEVLSKKPIPIPSLRQAKIVMVEVARKHGITLNELKGRRRAKHITAACQEAMWRMRKECQYLSFPQIGRLLGNRDHTTVLHGCRAHEKRMAAQ